MQLCILLILLAVPVLAQTLGQNETLSLRRQAEYYKAAARLTWAQLEVAQHDLDILRLQAERRDLFENARNRLAEMQAFQKAILQEGCRIEPDDAKVSCPEETDAEKDKHQEVEPETHQQELPGSPQPQGAAAIRGPAATRKVAHDAGQEEGGQEESQAAGRERQ